MGVGGQGVGVGGALVLELKLSFSGKPPALSTFLLSPWGAGAPRALAAPGHAPSKGAGVPLPEPLPPDSSPTQGQRAPRFWAHATQGSPGSQTDLTHLHSGSSVPTSHRSRPPRPARPPERLADTAPDPGPQMPRSPGQDAGLCTAPPRGLGVWPRPAQWPPLARPGQPRCPGGPSGWASAQAQ